MNSLNGQRGLSALDAALLSTARTALKVSRGMPGPDGTFSESIAGEVRKSVGIVDTTSDDAREHSAQARAQDNYALFGADTGITNSLFWSMNSETYVAPYGYLSRDVHLRALATLQGNDVVQSAITAVTQKVQSCEYIIEGPRRTAAKASYILKGADLGNGWEALISKSVQDWLTQDNGMFWEVIWSDGKFISDEQGAPKAGAVIVGIAHLDAGCCYRTGDPDYPVIYQSAGGSRHKLHRTRVVFQADMPSPKEKLLGRGFCALSRCLSMAQTLIRYSIYRAELLDDVPALGLLVLQNINKTYWENNLSEFQSQRDKTEQLITGNLMTLFNMDPTKPADANLIPFKSLWDNFDESAFYDRAIDLVAMAFGVDRQELAPLATSALGSGAQSTVLSQKSRGKGIGTILTSIERNINLLIPQSCTFKFDFHDDDQDMQQAAIREAKSRSIISLYGASSGAKQPAPAFGGFNMAGLKAEGDVPPILDVVPPPAPSKAEDSLITRDEARRLLAREIPEWSDIITAPQPEDEISFNDTELEAVNESEDLLSPALKMKAQVRYGNRARYYSTGQIKVYTPRPSISQKISHQDVNAALDYLRKMYL